MPVFDHSKTQQRFLIERISIRSLVSLGAYLSKAARYQFTLCLQRLIHHLSRRVQSGPESLPPPPSENPVSQAPPVLSLDDEIATEIATTVIGEYLGLEPKT